MKAQGKKHKGSRLERKFAQLIRQKGLDPNAKRMVLSGADWAFNSDILTTLPFKFECKNQERITFWTWWEQTKAQETMQKPGVLVFTSNHRPIMVCMDADTFLNVLLELKQYKEGGDKDEDD